MLPSGSAIERMLLGNERERLGNGARVLLRRAGDLAQGVDQHLGLQPPQRIVGEIAPRPRAAVDRGIDES